MPSTRVDTASVTTALALSVASVPWTVLASTGSVLVGVHRPVAVLVAFGAVGVVDAIGSVALSYHFHHARRHDELSDQIEAVAHRIVLVGLVVVGSSSIVGGGLRLQAAR